LSWRLALESCLGRLARWLGIIFVSIQALTNFLFIPAQLFWAIILILIDLWIIYALFVHRREPVYLIEAAERAAFAKFISEPEWISSGTSGAV